MNKIIKRIYSTTIDNNLFIIKKIPNCKNCVYFNKKVKKCEYFNCSVWLARLDSNKCGLFANKFIFNSYL